MSWLPGEQVGGGAECGSKKNKHTKTKVSFSEGFQHARWVKRKNENTVSAVIKEVISDKEFRELL